MEEGGVQIISEDTASTGKTRAFKARAEEICC